MRQTTAALECVYLLSSPEKVASTLVSARRVVTTRFAVPSSNGSCFAAGAEIEAMAGGELRMTAALVRHSYCRRLFPRTIARGRVLQTGGISHARC